LVWHRTNIRSLTWFAAFRERHTDVPLLVVIGGESAALRVAAFESGADDAITYPFALDELMVRVRALVRRRRQTRLTVGDLTLDLGAVTVDRGGDVIHLSVSEFRLLAHLVRHAGEIVRRDELEAVVCRDLDGTREPDNLLQAHTLKLRRKLEAGGRSALVHTIHGVGYICSERAPTMAKPRKPRR
jgi:DNA-binding response OmpR family regulator